MMLLAKNYQNGPVFHGVIQKIKVACFYLDIVYVVLCGNYNYIIFVFSMPFCSERKSISMYSSIQKLVR